MRRTILLLTAVGLFLPSASSAQEKNLEAAIAPHLYSPWVVLENKERLSITAAQSEAIVDRMTVAERIILPLQAEMEGRVRNLVEAVAGVRADTAVAAARLREVLDLEIRLKETHLLLLVEVKNLLNTEQQEIMRQIQAEMAQQGEESEAIR